jgi:hypothetical protein
VPHGQRRRTEEIYRRKVGEQLLLLSLFLFDWPDLSVVQYRGSADARQQIYRKQVSSKV